MFAWANVICSIYILQAYQREATALTRQGKHDESLATLALAVVQQPKNSALLQQLLENALKSPIAGQLNVISIISTKSWFYSLI